MALTDTHPKLGSYVVDKLGRKGRVTSVDHGHSGRSGTDWLTDEEKASRVWLSVLVDGGGSIEAPETVLTEIEPFPFTNNWASFYFAD